MDTFNYRGKEVNVYYDNPQEKIKFEVVAEGTMTTYEVSKIALYPNPSCQVQVECRVNVKNAAGKDFGTTKKALSVLKGNAEYLQFATMQSLGGLDIHGFFATKGINGFMQFYFPEDNLFCFNPVTGAYFDPIVADVSTTEDSITIDTIVDGTPVSAKLYDGSVSYIENLQGTEIEEVTSGIEGHVFSGLGGGVYRLFFFDAEGNFSHRLFTIEGGIEE